MFLLLTVILASCSQHQYPSIPADHNLAITVDIKDATVTFVDLDTREKLRQWKMDKPYIGGIMLPDGDTLLLYGKQVETVDLFSLKEGKKVGSWETGTGIVNGILLNNKKEIAFTDQTQLAVRFFTLAGKENGKVTTQDNPLTLIEDEKSDSLFVISFSAAELSEIDLKKRQIVNRFPIHSSAAGALLKEDEIWIGGHGEGADIEKNIHVYDRATGKMIRKISVPSMPISFAERDGNIFVLSHGTNTLYKIAEKTKITNSIKIGANPFDIKTFKDSIIVAGYDSNDVHIVNPDSLEIEKTIPVGKGPFQIILRERLEHEQH
jgi:YVTN family beta-propeller protein